MQMQSIDTNNTNSEQSPEARKAFDAGRIEDLPDGTCKTIELPTGRKLALFKVNGEFYATENFCPHIECELHGWQFDVRTGECLTVTEKIETYEVFVEDGTVKIFICQY